MGNKISKRADFVCPEDYNSEEFNKIVKIYKTIDPESGNFIKKEKLTDNHAINELAFGEYLMDLDELENIKNEKKLIHKCILDEIQLKAEEELRNNIKKEFKRHRTELLELEIRKQKLIDSNDKDKLEKVKKRISSNKYGFSFGEFFTYMKERIVNFGFLF